MYKKQFYKNYKVLHLDFKINPLYPSQQFGGNFTKIEINLSEDPRFGRSRNQLYVKEWRASVV